MKHTSNDLVAGNIKRQRILKQRDREEEKAGLVIRGMHGAANTGTRKGI